ncbi:MAG: hypothetical protein ACJA16_003628 [Akkermansiaceae bacterium]|jgi:hypothetical protein
MAQGWIALSYAWHTLKDRLSELVKGKGGEADLQGKERGSDDRVGKLN